MTWRVRSVLVLIATIQCGGPISGEEIRTCVVRGQVVWPRTLDLPHAADGRVKGEHENKRLVWNVDPVSRGVRDVIAYVVGAVPDSQQTSRHIRAEFLANLRSEYGVDYDKMKGKRVSSLPLDALVCGDGGFSRTNYAVRVGQPILIGTTGNLVHHFHVDFPKRERLHFTMRPKTMEYVDTVDLIHRNRDFDLVFVGDLVNSWILTEVAVFRHRLFATTDRLGRFEIRHAARGKLKLLLLYRGVQVSPSSGKRTRHPSVFDASGDVLDLGTIELSESTIN